MAAVAAGIQAPATLLRASWDQEESPFMGDWTFWDRLTKMADVPHPLLRIDGPQDAARFAESTLTLTNDGRRVLDGERDFVALNGIDCWYGGVHLQGKTAPWRWNEAAQRVVRVSGL